MAVSAKPKHLENDSNGSTKTFYRWAMGELVWAMRELVWAMGELVWAMGELVSVVDGTSNIDSISKYKCSKSLETSSWFQTNHVILLEKIK